MKLLSSELIRDYQSAYATLPSMESFHYPEKVLQFGTGVLLRGLPDYYIDLANKQGLFKGRIAVVKSTSHGGITEFEDQDTVYTICVKGIEDTVLVEKFIVNNAISRVLEANKQWQDILRIAQSPDLTLIISNTTEVGIVSSQDRWDDHPPTTFPGKLLSVLYHRYQYYNGDMDKGLVILPTELISDNGYKLKEIVLALAKQNNLNTDFIEWILQANDFCNTLVDRIVPGKLPHQEQKVLEQQLGYTDNLTIMAEPFSLWAIESDSERVKEKLSFADVDSAMIIVPSINKYKEIKLRLLNGTHTFCCAIALLAGFQTVKEAMKNQLFREYVMQLMHYEIGDSILNKDITEDDIKVFSKNVVDRFSNPFLEHKWSAIAMNYTAKLKMRCIPLLNMWYHKNNRNPNYMAFGFAAYLLLMDSKEKDGVYYKRVGNDLLPLQDEYANLIAGYWQNTTELKKVFFADHNLWGIDLYQFEGFLSLVEDFIEEINQKGILRTLESILR